RWAFVFSACLALLAGLLLIWLPASCRFAANRRLRLAFTGMFAHLADRHLLGGFLVGLTLFFSFVAIFSYLPFRLEAPPYGFSTLTIGLIYLVYVAGIVSSPLAGVLARRFGRRAVMVAGLGLALAANLATLAPGGAWLVIALLALCFGNFATQSAATAYVAEVAQHERAGASALYLSAYYVGGSLGAFLPGLLWTAYGWPGVLLLTCGSLALGMLAALRLCRSRAPRSDNA
ncbi:MAG TPA: MFS transporter, partial [Trueperaceae bacterium]